MTDPRLIETDVFPFEFLSQIAERESWRKEVHRPIYHVHKWWAKRLGTVFRGILLGCRLAPRDDLQRAFYETHDFGGAVVFDPFLGSGTTVGEAHKLGFAALGRDINPVAVSAATTAFGPLDRRIVDQSFRELSYAVGESLRSLYATLDSAGRPADTLYHFWVMQTSCPACRETVDLFPSYVFGRNAYPARKPEVQIVCPQCGRVFADEIGNESVACSICRHEFNPQASPAKGAKATCAGCGDEFSILEAVNRTRPPFRQFAKLVLTASGRKEYLKTTEEDRLAYAACSLELAQRVAAGELVLPSLALEHGWNTRQAMNYGFLQWRDFFNDRQLLALSLLRKAIFALPHEIGRRALGTLFSGVLEFNNVLASYKGEGTGAVRHMFSHHVLKPERLPIEAHVWGTPKSSGSFTNLYRSRLQRAIDYRELPTEVYGAGVAKSRVCSPAFSGELHPWGSELPRRAVSLSCGDSSETGLADRSVDLVVTDPPFFDNVHYSELADFFFAWQQLESGQAPDSTRSREEVQDADADCFAQKLQAVFREANRVLKDDGLLVFTYHHSRDEGWHALAQAILGAGFAVVNSHPVKAEMSVAAPKSQAKEPIQLDIILVCRKAAAVPTNHPVPPADALASAQTKVARLQAAGFVLSRNDVKIALFGQLLTTIATPQEMDPLATTVEAAAADFTQRITDPSVAGIGAKPPKHRSAAARSSSDRERALFE